MDGATRVWIDDPNPIFRIGLAASLRDSDFVVVGESAGLVPPPPIDEIDVLVFDLGDQSAGLASALPSLSRRHRRSTRLVGLVPGGDVEATRSSQCTVLVRSELTPEGFRDCIASVAAGVSAPSGSTRRPRSARHALAACARAAWVDTGVRWGQTLRRRAPLFAVVAALAAGLFGPSGRAEGFDGAVVAAAPVTETTPVASDGDAADDVAVWVNPADPAGSLVIGTDKRGGLESYDLKGRRVQRLVRPPGTVNNVDVRPGFSLGGSVVALVGTGGRAMSFFRVGPGDRQLHEVGARLFPGRWAEVGFCLYRSAVTGRFYAFTATPGGDVTQYELFDQGGLVDARAVRGWPIGSAGEGCVADDETGRLFVSEEQSGIWRFNAEPDASPLNPTLVDRVGDGHLVADVEGLALVTQPGRRGFLIASSQGDSTFAVYRRGRDNAWLGQRRVVDGPTVDGCSDTDGIEAVSADLGPDFPAGVFVCQDGKNTPPGPSGRQNFKFVRLENILDASSLPS